MLCAIPFATLELKSKVLDLMKNKDLEIYKKIQQGPGITRNLIKIVNDMGMMPLAELLGIHEEIFIREVFREDKTLDEQNIMDILQVFKGIREEREIEAYMKGLLARIEVSKFENREKIKNIIIKELGAR